MNTAERQLWLEAMVEHAEQVACVWLLLDVDEDTAVERGVDAALRYYRTTESKETRPA